MGRVQTPERFPIRVRLAARASRLPYARPPYAYRGVYTV